MEVRRRVARALDRLLEGSVAAIYAATILVMCTQVVLRYVFNEPLPWAEELSRYFFIWIVYLGAAIASRRAAHLEVDYFVRHLPPQFQSWIRWLFMWVVTVFLLFISVKGVELAATFMMAPSYTMEWLPQGIIYASVPLGAVLMIVNMWRAHRGSGERRPLGLSSLGDQM